MPVYKPFSGFIQFEPEVYENRRSVVIKPIGATGNEVPLLRVTIWPDFGDVNLSKGDFIAADGKFDTQTKNGKTYYNLSASELVVIPGVKKVTEEVENPLQEDDEDFDPGF